MFWFDNKIAASRKKLHRIINLYIICWREIKLYTDLLFSSLFFFKLDEEFNDNWNQIKKTKTFSVLSFACWPVNLNSRTTLRVYSYCTMGETIMISSFANSKFMKLIWGEFSAVLNNSKRNCHTRIQFSFSLYCGGGLLKFHINFNTIVAKSNMS